MHFGLIVKAILAQKMLQGASNWKADRAHNIWREYLHVNDTVRLKMLESVNNFWGVRLSIFARPHRSKQGFSFDVSRSLKFQPFLKKLSNNNKNKRQFWWNFVEFSVSARCFMRCPFGRRSQKALANILARHLGQVEGHFGQTNASWSIKLEVENVR